MCQKLTIIQYPQKMIFFFIVKLYSFLSFFQIMSQAPHILFPLNNQLNKMHS